MVTCISFLDSNFLQSYSKHYRHTTWRYTLEALPKDIHLIPFYLIYLWCRWSCFCARNSDAHSANMEPPLNRLFSCWLSLYLALTIKGWETAISSTCLYIILTWGSTNLTIIPFQSFTVVFLQFVAVTCTCHLTESQENTYSTSWQLTATSKNAIKICAPTANSILHRHLLRDLSNIILKQCPG